MVFSEKRRMNALSIITDRIKRIMLSSPKMYWLTKQPPIPAMNKMIQIWITNFD